MAFLFWKITAYKVYHRFNNRFDAEADAVVLYTSGSEGTPKGVVLSQKNILSNIRQLHFATDLTDSERVFNCLPMFHSFGLTVGLFYPLVKRRYSFLYPSPLHYKIIPKLIYDKRCTLLLSTNTFLKGLAKNANEYDFHSIRRVFVGAEKLQADTDTTWGRCFGISLLEGYGCTECAPVIATNTRVERKYGSVGRPLPGVQLKLLPVEGVEEGGRLFVGGDNVMKGYLNEEAQLEFEKNGGWYDTGDIVKIDEEGFITIIGRAKRFAKISGEMVSLATIEHSLLEVLSPTKEDLSLAVVSLRCEKRGERLVLMATSPLLQKEIIEAINQKGLSEIHIPRKIIEIPEIPILPTGKVDYERLRLIAFEAEEPQGKEIF